MDEKSLYERLRKKCVESGVDSLPAAMAASIPEQRLWLFEHGKSSKSYVMSSSKREPSCVENSLGTPWGLHEVCGKIGGDAPVGMIFKGRLPTGQCYWEASEEEQKRNLITSRILRLRGLEPGLNAGGDRDTYARYVYAHGTNHENKLGSPASSGCLQLSNADVVDLFERVPEGCPLLILRE